MFISHKPKLWYNGYPQLEAIKNWEDSDFTLLASWQIGLPQFHGCWQKVRGFRTRDEGLYHLQHSRQRELHVCSDSPCLHLKSHKGNTEAGPGWHWEHSGFVSQIRSAEFSKPPSFKRVAGQYVQPIPQMKTTLLSYPLPQSKTLSLPAKALHHTNILGMIVQNKPWHKTWRNARGPWRTVSQQRPYPAREK